MANGTQEKDLDRIVHVLANEILLASYIPRFSTLNFIMDKSTTFFKAFTKLTTFSHNFHAGLPRSRTQSPSTVTELFEAGCMEVGTVIMTKAANEILAQIDARRQEIASSKNILRQRIFVFVPMCLCRQRPTPLAKAPRHCSLLSCWRTGDHVAHDRQQ